MGERKIHAITALKTLEIRCFASRCILSQPISALGQVWEFAELFAGRCGKAAECGSTGRYGFMEQHVSNKETDEVSGRQKEGRKMNRGVLACWREQVQMALRVPSISNHSMIS